MRTDVFTAQGNSHPICQDYGIAGENFVVLSDGCSAAKDSDIGARLVCIAARNNIRILSHGPERFYTYLIEDLNCWAGRMGLVPDTFCSTLLVLYAGSSVKFFAIGDGLLIQSDGHGTQATKFSFSNNTPFYPVYAMFPTWAERWRSEKHQVQQTCDGNRQTREFDNDLPYVFWELAAAKTTAIATDGIDSFQQIISTETSSTVVPVPGDSILTDMLSFKSLAGAFVRRRCQRALHDRKKLGISHYDDLSLGVIVREDE